MEYDLKEAQDFLSLFNHSRYTFQFLKKGKPAGFAYSNTLEECIEAADHGKEIFFMVNQGDGVVYDGHTTCRSQENVTELTACFIDTDSCPIEKVTDYLKSIDLIPHVIVESSPGKYHLYFLLDEEDTHLSDSVIGTWKSVQECLALLGGTEPTGCDTAMKDHSRVLRVPGFYHLKAEPFRTRVVKQHFHAKYSLREIVRRTNAIAHSKEVSLKPKYTLEASTVPEGNRHAEMTAFLGHVLNHGLEKDIALMAFYKYAEEKFTDAKKFLPGGERHSEVVNFVEWKLSELEKEESLRRSTRAQEVLAQRVEDPFALPVEFYKSAPGVIGQIVSSMVSTARYPMPSFYFAAAVAALGTIKSMSFSSTMGHAPSNFFICLGPTGSGKNYAQEVLSHTFNKLGLSNLISSGIRSEKGIARFLENNHSCGLLSLDEAESFFTSLDDRNTPHYLKQCKNMLLEVYTSTMMPYKSLGQLGDKKEKPIVLRYPRLNVLAHGVLHTLETAFNLKTIQDGLLQRFIVLTANHQRERNAQFKPAAALNGSIYAYLESILVNTRQAIEQQLQEESQIAARLEAEPDPLLKRAMEQQLERCRANSRRMQAVPFSREGTALYESFADEMDSRINVEINKNSKMEGLFTRGAEQVGRLAIAMEPSDVITEETLDFCIKLIRSRIEATYVQCRKTMQESGLGQNLEALTQFVASKGTDVVPYREIVRGFRIRSRNELRDLLDLAVEVGDLEKISIGGNGKKSGKPGVGFRFSSRV